MPHVGKGGLVSESFFTLVQISKKNVPNDSPWHLFFGYLSKSEKLSEIKPPCPLPMYGNIRPEYYNQGL